MSVIADNAKESNQKAVSLRQDAESVSRMLMELKELLADVENLSIISSENLSNIETGNEDFHKFRKNT